MRNVVLYQPQEEVTWAKNANEVFYYGVRIDGKKGLIVRESFKRGEFHVRCVDGLTYGNSWSFPSNQNLSEVLTKILNFPNSKAFEFDTPQELFEWLAEKP
jgi:hypothetical protein